MPTRDQLISHAMRQLAGASLVVLAAAATGFWQYAAMAAALLPQLLVDLLALRDHDRRTSLRVTTRPVLVLVLSAVTLALVAVVQSLTGDVVVPVLAAISAAAGLAVAGAPQSITFAPARAG